MVADQDWYGYFLLHEVKLVVSVMEGLLLFSIEIERAQFKSGQPRIAIFLDLHGYSLCSMRWTLFVSVMKGVFLFLLGLSAVDASSLDPFWHKQILATTKSVRGRCAAVAAASRYWAGGCGATLVAVCDSNPVWQTQMLATTKSANERPPRASTKRRRFKRNGAGGLV